MSSSHGHRRAITGKEESPSLVNTIRVQLITEKSLTDVR